LHAVQRISRLWIISDTVSPKFIALGDKHAGNPPLTRRRQAT